MKIALALILAFLLYATIRQQAYIVDSAAYFEYLDSTREYDGEHDRFTFCGLVWKLREKQSIPLFTNCYTTYDDLIEAVRGKKADKFGTSIFQSQDVYHKWINAMVKYEYTKANKYLIAAKTLLFITHNPGPLLEFNQISKKCLYKDEPIEIYNTYDYGYWTDKGQILLPEAREVINCKEEK